MFPGFSDSLKYSEAPRGTGFAMFSKIRWHQVRTSLLGSLGIMEFHDFRLEKVGVQSRRIIIKGLLLHSQKSKKVNVSLTLHIRKDKSCKRTTFNDYWKSIGPQTPETPNPTFQAADERLGKNWSSIAAWTASVFGCPGASIARHLTEVQGLFLFGVSDWQVFCGLAFGNLHPTKVRLHAGKLI